MPNNEVALYLRLGSHPIVGIFFCSLAEEAIHSAVLYMAVLR